MNKLLCTTLVLISLIGFNAANTIDEDTGPTTTQFSIEGKVFPPEDSPKHWQRDIRIHVNYGEQVAFVREDGTFVIHNVPYGSYVVEAVHPDFAYEPARVEINTKGKFRARKVNYVQTSQVIQVPYPLRMKPLAQIRYFQAREQWRITDFLFNPMILMMVLPLLLVMVLPKMMNDPETKEDMKQIQNMTKMAEMPEMSEVITNLFSGGSTPKSKTVKQVKKKQ